MRIIKIQNSQALIQVNETELDTIVNNYLDLQYAIGYEEGYNDYLKACRPIDEEDDDNEQVVDDHRTEEEY